MLITFSGLDGAGKSTLIEWLKATLEQHDRRVTVFHMNDHIGIYAYIRLVRDGLLGTSPNVAAGLAPQVRAAGNGSPPPGKRKYPPGVRGAYLRLRNALVWSKPLRRLLYPLDVLVFLVYRFYVERIRKNVLILDRYFYDTLVDVSDGRHWGWIRLLERLTPVPDVPILLDIAPKDAYARKAEHSLERLQARWVAYRTVFPWVRSSLTIANDDLHRTQDTLRQVVFQRMEAR